jgi:hypothetical protein
MAEGGAFERKICKRLSQWVLRDPDGDVLFWRTHGSGARATVRTKKGKTTTRAHCGDIGATDERGAFLTDLITWELKYGYKDADLHKLLSRPASFKLQTYERWIDQAATASEAAKTPYWAIVHHKQQWETLLVIPWMLWKRLECSWATVAGPILEMTIPARWEADEGQIIEVVAVQFDEFLKGVTPTEIRNLGRAA